MSKRERAAPIIHEDGFTINGCAFHVDPKYKPIDAIGQGSYGVVCSVRNTDTNEKLAIKKITPMAGDEWDATHTLREIRLMRCLGAHENIISLKDLSMREDKDELYMMMELADTDLHRLIQSSCPLTEGHIRVIMFQILSGVKAMHDNGVLHRDLKPGNLLLNKDCELKVTDFGLARMTPKDHQQQPHSEADTEAEDSPSSSVLSPMTEYVVTRWYRPPELMLAPNGGYDGAVDMWSVGCILGELVSRKPMFPGTDFMDQLTRVFKVVPIPDKAHRGYTIEKDALKFVQSLPPTPVNAMEKLFKGAPSLALDLMRKLLCFNPRERISADAALAHPFFDGIKDEWGEIVELKLDHSLEFAFEQQSLPLATLRQYICQEVRAFREKEDEMRQQQRRQQQRHDSEDGEEGLASGDGGAMAKRHDTNGHGHAVANSAPLRAVNDIVPGRGFTLKGCDFNVPEQYKPLQVLGEGSYGIVCGATDVTTKKNVAIKKITPMAGDEWDAKHTLREIRLMRYFGHHPNIASLQNLSTCTEKDELYLMMDLVDTDLHRLIQSKTKLEETHVAAIMYQVLCGAKVLHENGVLHRDLKPGNLLVSKNCDVKITDFGLSRYIPHGGRRAAANGHEKGKDLMTEYVVTRWYRAPEIMLAPNGTYGEAVDMWSIGCIFGELLNRKPMFPGSDFIDQLTRVFSVLPVPTSDKRGYAIEGDALKFLESLPACSPEAITKLFRRASAEAVSLLRRLLCINPERRITAKQALAHPYFKGIRAQLGEPPAFQVPATFDFEFDYQEIPLPQLRQLIQDEVQLLQQDRAGMGPTAKAIIQASEPADAAVTTSAVTKPVTAESKSKSKLKSESESEATSPRKSAPAPANAHTPPSPITTETTGAPPAPVVVAMHHDHSKVPSSLPSRMHHQQEDGSEHEESGEDEGEEEEEEERDRSSVGQAARVSKHGDSSKPETDDVESVVSEEDAASVRSQQQQQQQQNDRESTSANGTSAVLKKANVHRDPQEDEEDDSSHVTGKMPQSEMKTRVAHDHGEGGDRDEGEEEEEEVIEMEHARRPVAGKLSRTQTATGTAASTAVARRAATVVSAQASASHRLHRTATTGGSSSNNDPGSSSSSSTTDRWGHPRATTARTSGSVVHSTSSGATAIHSKRQHASASAAAASRLLATSRSATLTSSSSSSSNQTATSNSTSSLHHRSSDKSDGYRHPERVVHSARVSSSSSSKEAPLPDGWIKRIHSKSGREYYYDSVHKVSSWKHPAKLHEASNNHAHHPHTGTQQQQQQQQHDHHHNNNTGSTSSLYSHGKQPHAHSQTAASSSRTAAMHHSTTSRRSVASGSTAAATPPVFKSTPTRSTPTRTASAHSSSPSGGSSMLPKDWERRTDPKTGRLYYVNLVTKKAFARLPSAVSASILNVGRESVVTTRQRAAAAAAATAASTKRITKPQSPNFSRMSWQTKRSGVSTGDE